MTGHFVEHIQKNTRARPNKTLPRRRRVPPFLWEDRWIGVPAFSGCASWHEAPAQYHASG